MTLENGASHDLRSVILFRSTHLARWTAVSCLIFTFAILPTGATMQSTSVIGFNFTVVRTFFILRSPQIRTLFVHPTHQTNMQNAITSCLFGNGSTSHTQIHISMVPLNLLPSEAAKAETEYVPGGLGRPSAAYHHVPKPHTCLRRSYLFDSR